MTPTRRRFMALFAAGAGLPLAAAFSARASATPVWRWQGIALGAEAELHLVHTDQEAATRLIAEAVGEIERLEAVFSLYREGSEISRLNRDGRLTGPSLDLVDCLRAALAWSRKSDGAFDPTVQPLWRLNAGHFATGATTAPDGAALDEARNLIDWRGVSVDDSRIAFARPGMALTLNGIAQGYITDRVAELLKRRGIERTLVHLGETKAVGPRPDGTPWRVAVPELGREIEAIDVAVATSSGAGTPFSKDGRHHHLFDPATGLSANHVQVVTAIAPSATDADALSTAAFVTPPARHAALLKGLPDARLILG